MYKIEKTLVLLNAFNILFESDEVLTVEDIEQHRKEKKKELIESNTINVAKDTDVTVLFKYTKLS